MTITIDVLTLFGDMLGKGYANGGRGPELYDCLGAALEGARRLGITVLDPFPHGSARREARALRRWEAGEVAAPGQDWPPGWLEVARPWAVGDFLVLEPTGGAFHVALALTALHALQASGDLGVHIIHHRHLPVLYGVRAPKGPPCA